jgi:acetylornithine deacetylase/succinyl-diaminopimelate desuccinylase-like protein
MELGPALTSGLTDPDRVLDTVGGMENLALAREAHACTHTTFSPNVIHGGVKTNVIPDRIEIDVDIRALPGVTTEDVDVMLAEALGDLAPRVTIKRGRGQSGSLSTHDTPLVAAMERVTSRLMPGSRVVPKMTTGGTDAKFWRWQDVPAYGFGLQSLRIPYTEYPLMFHGHNERVDTESLKLSTMMWESLAREFLG